MDTTVMNRQQRRLYQRAQRHAAANPRKARRATGLEGIALLSSCEPYRPGDTTVEHIKTREAFTRLLAGDATPDDFDRVAVAINLAKIRAMQIDNTLALQLEAAQDAMGACKLRYLQHGRFGFDGPALQTMREAMDNHEAIVDASTPRQMELALQEMARQLTRQNSQAKPGH